MRTISATDGSSSLPDASNPAGMAGSDSTSGIMNRLASTTAIANMVQPSRHDTSASFSGKTATEKATIASAAGTTIEAPHNSRFVSR